MSSGRKHCVKFSGKSLDSEYEIKRFTDTCKRAGKLYSICMPGLNHGYLYYDISENATTILFKLNQMNPFDLTFTLWSTNTQSDNNEDVVNCEKIVKYTQNGDPVNVMQHQNEEYILADDIKKFGIHLNVNAPSSNINKSLYDKEMVTIFHRYMMNEAIQFLESNRYFINRKENIK